MAGFGVEGKKTHVSGEQVRIAEGGYPGTLQTEEERVRGGCIKSIIYPFNLSSVLKREREGGAEYRVHTVVGCVERTERKS